jgi:mono/diheme cytochrome c family protein
MRFCNFVFTISWLIFFGVASTLPAADLAQEAQAVLVKYCFECHGPGGKERWSTEDYANNLNVLKERKLINIKSPAESNILRRMKDTDPSTRMPPADAIHTKLSAAEIQAVERWITAGAPNVEPAKAKAEPPRELLGVDYVISQVHRHLTQMDEADRQFQRYFLLGNLHNQTALTQAELRTARAALSKVINSLSWQHQMVLPVSIDPAQVILNIDLRDLRWELDAEAKRPDLWNQIALHYPYGLSHNSFPDNPASIRMWKEIDRGTGTSIPWIRADWFVTYATQPPLYHSLLFDLVVPEIQKRSFVDVELADRRKIKERQFNALDLEKFLQVDVARNLRMFRAIRSGDSESGVSTGPRVLERHSAAYGAYWKSYDFRANNEASLLQHRPLGPPGAFRDMEAQEFKHDGGEIIFNLPNGLQGYLLVDKKGDRIAYGPEDLVGDGAKTLGSFQIVNGISCMSCHLQGMKTEHTIDQVRAGLAGLPTPARELVRRLYVSPPEFQKHLESDRERYLAALQKATGSFRDSAETGEPVKAVSIRYRTAPITLAAAAAELGIPADRLKIAIEENPLLQRLGLTALANSGSIKRTAWEAGEVDSLFQLTAQALRRIGTPTHSQ